MAKITVMFRSLLKVVISVSALAMLIASIYLIAFDWTLLLKLWWLIPASIVAALEWKARNSDLKRDPDVDGP